MKVTFPDCVRDTEHFVIAALECLALNPLLALALFQSWKVTGTWNSLSPNTGLVARHNTRPLVILLCLSKLRVGKLMIASTLSEAGLN
jgi:hypothetical protein